MKKVIYKQFGDETVLQIIEQEMPLPTADKLLIRVKAVSINPLDRKVFSGEMKLMSGKKFPKAIGIDFAGVVDEVGVNVKGFRKGDEIMGVLDVFKGGALAQYITVGSHEIVLKPAGATFEESAALPLTGLSALQILERLIHLQQGQELLINGATGGIGVFAIQLAKARGAVVTAVAGSEGAALAKELGADTVIDHKRTDILQSGRTYDAVIDLTTKLSFREAKQIMKDRSDFVTTLPTPLKLLYSVLNNLFSSKKIRVFIFKPTTDGLNRIRELVSGGLRIVLDRTFAFEDVRQAYRESSKGRVLGKSVITIN